MIRPAALWRRAACLVTFMALVAGGAPVLTASATAAPSQSVVLDGVSLEVTGGVVALVGPFDAALPGSAVQAASATRSSPYRGLTVEAIPFGTVDPDEPTIGTAEAGDAPGTRSALQSFRDSQGAVSLGPVAAQLFGVQVEGAANLVSLQLNGPQRVPTVVVEWATQAGPRLWVVRAAAQVSGAGTAAALAGISGLAVSAAPDALATSTTVGSAAAAAGDPVNGPSLTIGGSPTVPFPSWWSGDCDTNNYAAASLQLTGQAIPAHRLSPGAVWNGLEACGPRPYYNEGPDVSVRYPGAGWGVLEFECVELSMRWMYEAWGVMPYPANGSEVVWDYSPTKARLNPDGPNLVAVANDGSGALPSPGDVLSYGPTSEDGHTSVVTGVSVDSSGNGSVTVLEQNASASGWDTVRVTDWVLNTFESVSGWLHNPAEGTTYVPTQGSASYLLGDFTGNGRDGLAAIAAGSTWVMPSSGPGLEPPSLWYTHASYGDKATLAGDVTGDGRDDLVAVGSTGTWVFPSTGSSFAAPQQWSDVPFFGTQATLLADLTGNGRDDLVAVDATSVWVMLSTGSGFGPPEQWWGQAFGGTQATLAANVDGSGRDSLVAVNGTSTWVLPSTGLAFSAPTEWSSASFSGTQATLAGDLTGDGRSDLIAVNAGSVSVMVSTGTGFQAPATWVTIPFAGTSATLVGDVAGQGKAALVAVDGPVAWTMQSTGSSFNRPVPWLLS